MENDGLENDKPKMPVYKLNNAMLFSPSNSSPAFSALQIVDL